MNGEIKKHICKKRAELNLSQTDVAEKVGISLTAYRNLESGKTKLVSSRIAEIAQALEISSEELVLGYKPSPESSSRLKEREMEREKEILYLKELLKEKITIIEKLEEIIRDKDEIIGFQKKIIGRLD